jgi:hypothetical protein
LRIFKWQAGYGDKDKREEEKETINCCKLQATSSRQQEPEACSMKLEAKIINEDNR